MIKDYAVTLLECELLQTIGGGRRDDQPSDLRLLNYVLSTNLRRNFLLLCVKTGYENKPLYIKESAVVLECSLNAVRTMTKECIEEGWIKNVTSQHMNKSPKVKYGCVHSQQNLIDSWEAYAIWHKGCFKVLLDTI